MILLLGLLLCWGQSPILLHLQPGFHIPIPRSNTSIILYARKVDILTHSPLTSIPETLESSFSTPTLDRFSGDPDTIFPVFSSSGNMQQSSRVQENIVGNGSERGRICTGW
jgi:hypothetical protein